MVRLLIPEKSSKRHKAKHRRIRAISIAPAMLTLGNLLCGFAAIHFAARPEYTLHNPLLMKWLPTNLALACYLVFAAMICDALDGRLARMARTTSDFGGQLDSLADIVSFGVAPAFIAVRLIMKTLASHSQAIDPFVSPAAETVFGRFCWLAAGTYLACGALRLARFNVENVPDESAHMHFKGLPVPGAAGTMIAIVLLSDQVIPEITSPEASKILAKMVPWIAIVLGLMMVSRLPYVHVVNKLLRGKKPFWSLVAVIFSVMIFMLKPKLVLAVVLCAYALSGPAVWVFRKLRDKNLYNRYALSACDDNDNNMENG